MKKIYCFILLAFGAFTQVHAQGCVAIRQFSSAGNAIGQLNFQSKGEWTLSANYRYFKSFRHFRGTYEEPERVALGTEVINWSYGVDLNASFAFTDRVFGLVSLPFAYNERSSLYEHGRQNRHSSYSQGLSDIRLGIGYWLLDQKKSTKGNLSAGLGLKLPTGNFHAESTFYNVGPSGSSSLRPVDQSIQLGDGGVGFSIESQGLRELAPSLFGFYSAFYLFSPRNTNGTNTFRARASEAIMSVPDQFALRTGVFLALKQVHGLGFSLGGRVEGIPIRDIFGKSDGFRRPGYVVSLEPGISYMVKNVTATLNVPIALLRNRTRSLTDIADSTPDNFRHGDAAFADYLINFGIAFRIPKKIASPFELRE